MAHNTSDSNTKDLKEEDNKIDPRSSLLFSFDDETDSMHSGAPPKVVRLRAQSKVVLTSGISIYDFSEPLKEFDMDVSYDSVEIFYQDLGFNDITIERLKPYFSALESFVHYDVFAIIERLEEDILADDNNADKLSIKSQEDFFQILRLFGFQNEWAQTYTWAMGKAYADQLVKHSIEECIRLRLSPSNTLQAYPDWSTNLENNQWQTYSTPEFRDGNNFFIRKQDRHHSPRFGQNLNDIDFNDLVNLTRANHENTQYWFHATSWDRAENILRSGAERRGDYTDFSKGPAYYLNNDYRDCYEFLFQRNHSFRGQHAILIYEFDPKQLSNRQNVYLNTDSQANQRRWRQIVFSCISHTVRNEIDDLHRCDCVFGWQCANPNDIHT